MPEVIVGGQPCWEACDTIWEWGDFQGLQLESELQTPSQDYNWALTGLVVASQRRWCALQGPQWPCAWVAGQWRPWRIWQQIRIRFIAIVRAEGHLWSNLGFHNSSAGPQTAHAPVCPLIKPEQHRFVFWAGPNSSYILPIGGSIFRLFTESTPWSGNIWNLTSRSIYLLLLSQTRFLSVYIHVFDHFSRWWSPLTAPVSAYYYPKRMGKLIFSEVVPVYNMQLQGTIFNPNLQKHMLIYFPH